MNRIEKRMEELQQKNEKAFVTYMTAGLPEEVKVEWAKKIPLRRGGTPEDVANVALFLASDLSSYVSGQVIQIDGGMNM